MLQHFPTKCLFWLVLALFVAIHTIFFFLDAGFEIHIAFFFNSLDKWLCLIQASPYFLSISLSLESQPQLGLQSRTLTDIFKATCFSLQLKTSCKLFCGQLFFFLCNLCFRAYYLCFFFVGREKGIPLISGLWYHSQLFSLPSRSSTSGLAAVRRRLPI